MSRRFFVPAVVLAAFLSMLLVQRQLSAQEAPGTGDSGTGDSSSAAAGKKSRRRPSRHRHRADAGRGQRSGPRPAAGTRRV